jgi:hypothetical protein
MFATGVRWFALFAALRFRRGKNKETHMTLPTLYADLIKDVLAAAVREVCK